jgi:hypothetical protein
MSDIFVNYDDVRGLFSSLAKLSRTSEKVTINGVATGIGLADFEIFPRLKLPAPALPGINLDSTAISNLLTFVGSSDLPGMRNTERLNGFCHAFGWKADAMMHFLKSTTGRLGRNPSLLFDWCNFNDLWTSKTEKEAWVRQFEKGVGLYIIAGPPGHGTNQTMRDTVVELKSNGVAIDPAPIPAYVDFDGEYPSNEYLSELDQRFEGSTVLYGQAFDDRAIHMALHFATTKIVVLLVQAASSHEALHLVRRQGDDAVKPVQAVMAMRRFFEPGLPLETTEPLRSISARTILDPRNVPEHTYWPKPFKGHLFHIATAIIGLAAKNLITPERANELVHFEVERKTAPDEIAIGNEIYSSMRR